MRLVLLLAMVIVALVCGSAYAEPQRHIVDGYFDANGNAVAFVGLGAPNSSPPATSSSSNQRVAQSSQLLPDWYPSPYWSLPGNVIVGPPVIVDPPLIIRGPTYYGPTYYGPTYYWHDGHWYRSELTGYQWRWRPGHWCTNPNPH